MSRSMKLVKHLANLGYGSRKEVAWMFREGRVTDAAGEVLYADDPLDHDNVRVDGEPLDPPQGLVLVLNKPAGCTCSSKDRGRIVYDLLPPRFRLRDPALSTVGRLDRDTTGLLLLTDDGLLLHRIVFDLLPPRFRLRDPVLSTVGRLDRDTSGLLLLTDDGQLLHRIISPKAKLPKVYVATLAEDLRGDEAALFASGTLLLEGEKAPLLPAELEVLGARSARLTLHEGRYHQVRRMLAAVGNHVEALHRERIGGLTLADLPAAEWRALGEGDRARLFASG